MANRLRMAKVHSIQTLHAQGWSQRRIARTRGVDRETVARYVHAAAAELQDQPNLPAGSDEHPAIGLHGQADSPGHAPPVTGQNQPNPPAGSRGHSPAESTGPPSLCEAMVVTIVPGGYLIVAAYNFAEAAGDIDENGLGWGNGIQLALSAAPFAGKAIGAFFGQMRKLRNRGACATCGVAGGVCFVAGTPVWIGPDTTLPIEQIQLGQPVASEPDPLLPVSAAMSFSLASPDSDDYDIIDSDSWWTVMLAMRTVDDRQCTLELLRPVAWFEHKSARIGVQITISIPELGLRGNAKVLDIGPCPELEPCPSGMRRVVGRFRTFDTPVLALYLRGQDDPIGTTERHPIWSVSRARWVAAGDLKVGESLQTRASTPTTVVNITPGSGNQTVYNLEVHKDHTCFVSDARLWVHNNYTVLQTGGRTISNATAEALGLTRDQAKRAIEALKRDLGRGAADHSHKIWSTGNVTASNSGQLLGNLFDYLP